MNYLDVIKRFDNKDYFPIYVFYGEEKYLFESLVQKIEKETRGGFQDFNLNVFSGSSYTLGEIMDSAETLPVGSEYKYVVVKETSLFQKQSGATAEEVDRFKAYLKFTNPTTVIVFEANGIDKTSALYKATNALGYCIELAKVDSVMFSKWVAKQFKENGKKIDKETLKAYVDGVGYSHKDCDKTLVEIKNEIDKICARTLDDVVSVSDFERITENVLFKSVFDMVDFIGGKNAEMSIRIYRDLLSKKKEPREIFPLVVRHFRILKSIKSSEESGRGESSLGAVFKAFNLPAFTHKKYREQTRYFTEPMIDRILKYCVKLDYDSKSRSVDFERELETLIIKACKISVITGEGSRDER